MFAPEGKVDVIEKGGEKVFPSKGRLKGVCFKLETGECFKASKQKQHPKRGAMAVAEHSKSTGVRRHSLSLSPSPSLILLLSCSDHRERSFRTSWMRGSCSSPVWQDAEILSHTDLSSRFTQSTQFVIHKTHKTRTIHMIYTIHTIHTTPPIPPIRKQPTRNTHFPRSDHMKTRLPPPQKHPLPPFYPPPLLTLKPIKAPKNYPPPPGVRFQFKECSMFVSILQYYLSTQSC